MKGKARTILLITFLVVDAVIVAGVVGWIMIDRVAASGVRSGTSYALGVDTELRKADVRVFGGRFALSGLRVGNPEGFDAPHFLALEDGRVDADLRTLLDDVVELPELRLEGLDVHLQRRGATSNYQVILDNLERLEGAPAGEPEPAPEGKGYIVRVVELRDITVHADLLPEGGEMTRASVRVPAITLRDVGTAADPVSLPEMTSIVVRALLTAAIEAPGLPDGMLDDLRGRLEALGSLGAAKLDMARQEADKAADKARDAAEGLADDAADAIDSAAGGLGERLRGLRPGGGKEGDGDGGKDGQKQPQEPAQEPAKDPG